MIPLMEWYRTHPDDIFLLEVTMSPPLPHRRRRSVQMVRMVPDGAHECAWCAAAGSGEHGRHRGAADEHQQGRRHFHDVARHAVHYGLRPALRRLRPVLRLFPPCAPISHAQGSSGVVENMPFAWRGHTKSLTTRARPSPNLAVWLEQRRPSRRTSRCRWAARARLTRRRAATTAFA